MRQVLFISLFFLAIVAQAAAPQKYMTIHEAYNYCATHGSRLPTAREYAEYAQSLGAIGISVANNGGELISPSDLQKDSTLKHDQFFYNRSGYIDPGSTEFNNYFWTSSIGGSYTNWVFAFQGHTGQIEVIDLSNDSLERETVAAVRCIAK